jgi:hypothetical protein
MIRLPCVGRTLAASVLGAAFWAPAHAADGCTVLLCLAGNWKNIAECRPPVEEMMREVARGRHFPGCDSSGNSQAGNTYLEPALCPIQYRRVVGQDENLQPLYGCPFANVVNVAVEGVPWSRTYWSGSDSVTEWLPAARAAFAQNPTDIDERFNNDYAAWAIAEQARLAAEAAAAAAEAAKPPGGA